MSPAGLGISAALALAAAVAAAVVALYLLRPPPQGVRVASTLLWARVVAARTRSQQRWRWWLSLLLALVIGLALAAALGWPEAGGAGAPGRERVLVLDTGVTMGALRSDGGSRLELARRLAREDIARAPAGTRFLVADTRRAVSTGGFVPAADALRALDAMTTGADARGSFPDLGLQDAPAGGREVVLYTDGVSRPPVPAGTRVVSVFERGPNLGITAFNVRALPADATRHEAFVEVGNAGTAPVAARVRLSGPGREPLERPLQVPARGFAGVSFPVSEFGGGALQAQVDSDDDRLAADDSAYAFLPFNRVLRVALVTPGDPSLVRALRLDPRVRLTVLPPGGESRGGTFDAWVFDRVAPATAPAAPALVFRPRGAAWPAGPGRELASPAVTAWRTDAPVLENVSLADVQFERASALQAPAAAVVLARAGGGETLLAAVPASPRRVLAGFAPAESNFASLASFPVFLANSLQWLTEEWPPRAERAGAVRVALESARASGLESGPLDARPVPGGTVFTVPRPDFVTVQAPAGRLRVVVNVADPAATDINASDLTPATVTGPAAAPLAPSGPEPWQFLLALAGLGLLAEWFAWHRRLTV